MYLNLRRYPRIGVSKGIIERSVETELLPELGFAHAVTATS